jgi:predicted negative regulator of RcsB-dependent stress response
VDDHLSENEQWEALKRWLKENGAWIVGGIVIGGGLLVGYRQWDKHTTQQSQAAAAEFSQLQAAVTSGNAAEAEKLTGDLHQQFESTPYADHAELSLARLHVEKGELDKAAEKLRTIADKSDDKYLREVARLRLARVELAQNKPDAALATLGETKAGAFSAAYSEVRGDVLLAKGDRSGALDAYRAAFLESQGAGGEGSQLQLKINELTTVADTAPPAPKEAPAEGEQPKTESAPK